MPESSSLISPLVFHLNRFFERTLARRHGLLWLFLTLFIVVSLATRLALVVVSAKELSWNASLVGAFALGLVFDVATAVLIAAPLGVLLALLPTRAFTWRWLRAGLHVAAAGTLALLLFGAVAELLFWDEFSVRFNFIAVDYLVYTTEVLANIRESYPLPAIFGGIAAVTGVGYTLLLRGRWLRRWLDHAPESTGRRWGQAGLWTLSALVLGFALDSNRVPSFANTFNREVAKNGLWSLFAAFRNNELDYRQFYAVIPTEEAFAKMRSELASDRSVLLPGTSPHDTLRWVPAPRPGAPELRPNVIQITVESLSAEFLSTFNPQSQLTPELAAIAPQSLVFTQFYATGTRTDRGMEALTLSLPPTPGRSLIKRPRNENLFTLGSVFRSRGYDTAFIYGGYGYFDNMNAFFGGNGYRVVDRASVADNEITFANAWGACDGDLYRWTLREADQAAAKGQPFHFFVMTTSNHRPFTYPEGKIDLPSKVSGRSGAVKYTDYAIGEFLRAASTKPWYRNTIFVIVADHCASVAGQAALPVQHYHIPLILFAPGGQIAPGKVNDLMSQVDYAPTLLGLLNWSYASRFFGWDVLHASGDRRALIGNYQRVGLYEPGMLTVLRPIRGVDHYDYDPKTFALTPRPPQADQVHEAIAYYQVASHLYREGLYRALTPEEQARYRATAEPRVAQVPVSLTVMPPTLP
jgi:phosphoglycerol transferase MdoB-like AlkP superfamily enzyme